MKNEQSLEVVKPGWSCSSRVKAFCTTRKGGYSDSPYDSLNLAEHVGDDPDRVAANRDLLRRSLDLPAEPNWLTQIHSTRVVVLEQDSNRVADAAITQKPGMPAVIMIADCLPILLCNKTGGEVAAIHAGWRGLAEGVVESTLETMSSSTDQLLAWIGPGISQQCFEVGDDVREKYLARSDQYHRYFSANRPGHWLCDLPGLATEILSACGVTEITRACGCSYQDGSEFFSYRRNAMTGRMACLIWIDV
jgi:YfiH family protein